MRNFVIVICSRVSVECRPDPDYCAREEIIGTGTSSLLDYLRWKLNSPQKLGGKKHRTATKTNRLVDECPKLELSLIFERVLNLFARSSRYNDAHENTNPISAFRGDVNE